MVLLLSLTHLQIETAGVLPIMLLLLSLRHLQIETACVLPIMLLLLPQFQLQIETACVLSIMLLLLSPLQLQIETAGDAFLVAGGLLEIDKDGFMRVDPNEQPAVSASRVLELAKVGGLWLMLECNCCKKKCTHADTHIHSIML